MLKRLLLEKNLDWIYIFTKYFIFDSNSIFVYAFIKYDGEKTGNL